MYLCVLYINEITMVFLADVICNEYLRIITKRNKTFLSYLSLNYRTLKIFNYKRLVSH